jgi:hypothetical protein
LAINNGKLIINNWGRGAGLWNLFKSNQFAVFKNRSIPPMI